MRAFAGLNDGGQIFTGQVLHGDVKAAFDFSEIVDANHVGVVDARGESRLVEEHLNELMVFAQLGKNDLQHRGLFKPVNPVLNREPNLRHASGGDAAKESVATELNWALGIEVEHAIPSSSTQPNGG